MFRHYCPPSGETCKYAGCLVHKKKIGEYSLPIDMLFSAASVLVVAQPSSKVLGGTYELPCSLNANVSGLCLFHLHGYLPAYEDGTDSVFRNVGI
jgi:hypothetical protein